MAVTRRSRKSADGRGAMLYLARLALLPHTALANVHLKMMAYQLGFPPDAVIGDCTIRTYHDVLGQLIAWALEAHDRGEEAAPRSEQHLIAALASTLAVDPAVIGR